MSTLPDEIAGRFAEHAALEFHEGRVLPVVAYSDPRVLAAERATIFADGWVAVAHVGQLSERGSYVVVDVPSTTVDGQRSVIVVRGNDAEIRVFDNTCIHRGAELLAGFGVTERITCPYHAWTYRLDGSLIGGPYMHAPPGSGAPDFHPGEHSLGELAVEVWEGFVFVNQRNDALPLATQLSDLTTIVEQFQMAGFVPVARRTEVWATNWKLLVENFMDAYHVFKVHQGTFAKDGDSTLETVMFPGTPAWAHHRVVHESGADIAHPSNTTLEGSWRKSVLLVAVFPTFVVQLQPDWLWWLQISPIDSGRVQIRWHLAIAPEMLAAQDNPEAYVAEVLDLIDAVNAEDQPVVEGVRRRMDGPQFGRGPLSYLERNVYDFDRYLANRLAGPPVP
jgi:phenylpropionate dioxygenase-like ring-hydroxylating dioxygenase large terminal subunit